MMSTRRGRAPGVVALCAMVLLGWALPARAQSTPEAAVLTEWDVFAATGGTSTASQNVAAVVTDVSGKAGTAGSVWLTTQMPLPRIGVVNPAATTDNYTEWRPITTAAPGGPPLGLALNNANGDLWMAMAGDPSFVVKTANSNVFRRFRSSYPLTPKGLVIAGDNSAIAALPGKNAIGIGNAIVKVPRGGASGTTVTITLWNVGGEPHFVALDGSANIWFNERAANKLARLNPASGLVTEWALPGGTLPVGLQVSGSVVCVVSEGFPNALTGVEHCLNSSSNQITTYARVTGDGFNYPQRTSINSDLETFITEPTSNAVSFVAFAARAAAPVATVTPTTRTVAPTTSTLTVSDVTIAPTTYSITPSSSTLAGADNGGGYVRFSLPVVNDQAPQPVSLTPVFNDQGRGTGSVFFGEYFNGPAWGRFTAGRLARLDLTAAAPEPAVIVANPQALQFDAVVGGAAPGSATIAITEANGGSLSWTATESASWLTLTPASGAAPASLTVTANHASLAAGTYTQDITLDDGAGGADPKTVTVTLNVTQPDMAALSPASLTFSAVAGGNLPAEQLVTVTNAGTGTLDWVATANQSWVVIRKTSGSAPSSIPITVNPADMSGGTQTATLTITSADALNSPRTLTITVNVTNPPTISLSPASMAFSVVKGGTAAAQTLDITNSGSGTLQWTVESDVAWLIPTPTTGNTAAAATSSVSIALSAGSLAAGTYTGNLSIVDPDAGNSPQSIPVTLTVTQPTITLTPSTLAVTAVRTISPGNETIAIGNTGAGALNYTTAVTSGSSWLSVSSGGSGTVAPSGSTSLVLAFNTASLAVGVHTATVDVIDPAATNTPQTMTVTLTVTAPVISVSPASLAFTVNEGSNPSSQNVTVSNTGDAVLTFTPAVATVSGGSWLSVSPAGSTTVAAGANTTLAASIASAALAPGSYSGTMTIADSTGGIL